MRAWLSAGELAEQLQRVLREVLTAAGGDEDELRARPFALYVDERAVDAPLARVLERAERSTEGVLSIVYQPQVRTPPVHFAAGRTQR